MKSSAKKEFSIVVPVLHEAERINNVIESLVAADADSVEIIVVDGDPNRDTVRAIRNPGIITAASLKGRAEQMNKGASLATGKILIFLHADTQLPPRALRLVQAAIGDGRFKAGAFQLGIDSTRWIFRITERYVALRTRITRVPFGDQAIFVRREYFREIGGYRNMPLMEDVELMRRIKKSGEPICIVPEKVMTSPRRWEREGILFCTLRNWALQIGYCLGVSPDRLVRWYG